MNRDSIANFIKEQRDKVGMTQQDLAEILCTSRENISKWERGLAVPNTEYLKPLCDALQVSITDLLSGKIASNEEDASNIIYDIINTNQRIKKRFSRIMITTIILAIFIFLTYYFIDNYNSIKIYTFDSDTEGYELDNSLLLILKKKGYFIFNDITIPKDEEIQNTKLYFYDVNNNKILIYDSNKLQKIIKVEFDISKVNELINNTYMEITTNKGITITKLKIRKKYSNNELFESSDNASAQTSNDNFYFDNFEFPPLEEFTYNEKENVYNYKKGEVIVEYYPQTKKVALFTSRKNNNIVINLVINGLVLYNYNQDNVNENYCYYNYKEKNVIKGDCQNYITNLDILVRKYLEFIAE